MDIFDLIFALNKDDQLLTEVDRREAQRQANIINTEYVSSDAINTIGYDGNTQVLEVQFTDGSEYSYYNVNKNIAESILNSGSKGKFFNTYIKQGGRFPYTRNK